MAQYIQGGGYGQRYRQPDIRDLLALLEFVSPEHQQTQQAQLANLQATTAETQARTHGYDVEAQQKQATGPLTLDQLRANARLAGLQADSFPQQAQDEHALRSAQLDKTLAELSFDQKNNPQKLAYQDALTQRVLGETQAQQFDPAKELQRTMLARQAMTDSTTAEMVANDPTIGPAIQRKKASQDAAMASLSSSLAALHSDLPQSQSGVGGGVDPFAESSAHQLGSAISSVPYNVVNAGYNAIPFLDRAIANPTANFFRGLFNYPNQPPALGYANLSDDMKKRN